MGRDGEVCLFHNRQQHKSLYYLCIYSPIYRPLDRYHERTTVSFRAYLSSWWRTELLTRGRRGRRWWTRRKWFANRFDTMVYLQGLWSHAYCRRMFLLSRTWGAKSKVRWIRFDFLALYLFECSAVKQRNGEVLAFAVFSCFFFERCRLHNRSCKVQDCLFGYWCFKYGTCGNS